MHKGNSGARQCSRNLLQPSFEPQHDGRLTYTSQKLGLLGSTCTPARTGSGAYGQAQFPRSRDIDAGSSERPTVPRRFFPCCMAPWAASIRPDETRQDHPDDPERTLRSLHDTPDNQETPLSVRVNHHETSAHPARRHRNALMRRQLLQDRITLAPNHGPHVDGVHCRQYKCQTRSGRVCWANVNSLVLPLGLKDASYSLGIQSN